jgi:hypothetical protein
VLERVCRPGAAGVRLVIEGRPGGRSVQVNSDFLNRCAATGVTCVPFDNSRLPGYDGGALPPTK